MLNHTQGCCDTNSLVIGASLAGDTIRVTPVGKQTGALTDTVEVLIASRGGGKVIEPVNPGGDSG